jgi:hypothetical protein
MRAPILAVLLAALAPLAAAQEAFTDPDFGFQIKLPAGLKPVDEAGRLALLGGDAKAARNTSRAEAGADPVQHHFFWLDETSPYNRQVSVYLLDAAPPWKPEAFGEAMAKSGLTVESQEAMRPPVAGARVEGTFLREPDKVALRKTVLYLADPFGKRYGLVTLQANASDWSIVKDEFHAALESTRMARQAPPKSAVEAAKQGGKPGAPGMAEGAGPKGAGKGGKGPGKATAGDPAAAAQPAPEGRWGSLPVLGSLILAAAALAHLLLSGRSAR